MRVVYLAAFLYVLGALQSHCSPASAAELLTVGSAAPELNIEHWVQNGGGKFEPVTKFKEGKVYVVEFWATWCGPCIASMPHLAELQKKLADKGVQIVSISDEDLETVEKFLDREIRGQEETDENSKGPKTYRDLTSAYCLTTDPDQSSYRDYMEAAAQGGIPTAFIVGKDAKIEWIGHPMSMDEPLAAVVDGTWDREAEMAKQKIFELLNKQDFDAALAAIDELAGKLPNDMQLAMLKLQVLIVSEKTDAAVSHLKTVYSKSMEQPEMVNVVAWNIYEMSAQGRIENSEDLVNASIVAVDKAIEKAKPEDKSSILDTLAHLYSVKGNLDKAILLEREAMKTAKAADRDFMESFLKELLEQQKQQQQQKEEPIKK